MMSDNVIFKKLIMENYDLEINDLRLFEGQFCAMYSMKTNKGRYFVKTQPHEVKGMKNEGYITDYLYNNGISVPRIFKTKSGMYHVETEDFQFHIQEFIDGEILKENTAPEWFLKKSADMLGKIHSVLKNYDGELLPIIGNHFLDKSAINYFKNHYNERLNEAVNQKNNRLIPLLEERVRNLERVSAFDIDINKLTCSNSHADFHIGQIIADGENITVVDWTSAGITPICFEVIRSYVYAAPECRNGEINSDGLKRYINYYLKNFALNDYDIKMMPYVFYFQQMIWNYSPPYDDIPEAGKDRCKLIQNFTKWLYENVDDLSRKLGGM